MTKAQWNEQARQKINNTLNVLHAYGFNQLDKQPEYYPKNKQTRFFYKQVNSQIGVLVAYHNLFNKRGEERQDNYEQQCLDLFVGLTANVFDAIASYNKGDKRLLHFWLPSFKVDKPGYAYILRSLMTETEQDIEKLENKYEFLKRNANKLEDIDTMAKDTISIGFEDKIWKAADVLRGNLNASEYEGVVLGLIFLKYISDRFETKYAALVQDPLADPEDKDEYMADNVFFVPKEARWSVISADAHQPSIGVTIDNALRLIEQENPRLKGILPKNFARPELDKRRLGDVVDLFTNIQMHGAGDERDLLGRTYEYCLQKFASMEGKNAGEFYTPSCIVRTIVEVLQPYSGRIYDPCCGSGGMFVQSAKFIRSHQKEVRNISIYGQEANPSTWKMAHMNIAIRGLEADLGKSYADTFFDDQHPTLKADYIMANPPFNLSDWGQASLLEDVRWKFGIPPAGNANFAWIQHMIHHLSPNGKIGLVLANGALSSQTGGEGDIRANIVKADLVEGIVALPNQLFYSTGIPVSLWFLNRDKKQKGKVLFIDARNLGTMVTRKLRELTEEDILRIADTFRQFEAGALQDEKGFCAVASLDEVAQQDYILTPGRYVGIAEQEDDGEPFAEKMTRLTAELSELFDRGHELEAEIRKQLESIGYKIG